MENENETYKGLRKIKKQISKNFKYTKITSVIQIVLLVIIVYQVSSFGSESMGIDNSGNGKIPSDVPNIPANPPINMEDLIDDDAVKGKKNAPVTIIEFSDFECPFCANFYAQTLPQIEKKYIDTGKVKFVYRDYPLDFHQQAQKAAEAAECAGEQNKYYEMHDLLFERGVQGGVTSFKNYAKAIKLDTNKFNSCLDSGKMAGEVAKDIADGLKYGIKGTPGFIVNGKIISGAQPFQVFDMAIQDALNG